MSGKATEVDSIHLVLDQRAISTINRLANSLYSFSEVVDCPVEIIEAIDHFRCGPSGIDLELLPTTRARDYWVSLQFGERFLKLMAAVDAADGDVEFIDSSPGTAVA